MLPHLHRGLPTVKAENIRTSWDRNFLLILAITLHNIPEGLAVGVAFGAAVVMVAQPVLPYALSFAAGAMIFW